MPHGSKSTLSAHVFVAMWQQAQSRDGDQGMMNRYVMFGLGAAFLWGTHSVLVRYLTTDMSGVQIATLRLYIALATIFVVFRLRRYKVTLPLRDVNFWLAALATFANYIFFHVGLVYTSAASAMVLENCAPIFVFLFLLVFARTGLRWQEAVATVLAVGGVTLTILPDLAGDESGFRGDLLEIAAGAAWAVFLIASSQAMQKTQTTNDRLGFLFGVFAISAILMTPVALLDFRVPAARDIPALLFLGIAATALLYFLWYEAAAGISTIAATLMFTASVVFTFVNDALFLHERIDLFSILGGILIVLGVVLAVRPSGEAKETP